MKTSSNSRIGIIGFIASCLLAAVLSSSAIAQESGDINGLKLSVAVTGQDYCTVAQDAFTTVLHLKLTFTNVSERNVILARRFTAAPGGVAKSVEDVPRNQWEIKPERVEASTFPGMSPWSLGPRPPELFATLKPGETMTGTFDYPVLTSASKDNPAPLSITAGEHVLAFRLDVWPYPGAGLQGIKNLRNRWKRFGRLAAGIVEAEPVPFAVPDSVTPRACTTTRPRLPGWKIVQK